MVGTCRIAAIDRARLALVLVLVLASASNARCASVRYPAAFTVTLNSATTSLRNRIATVCSPTVLIGS